MFGFLKLLLLLLFLTKCLFEAWLRFMTIIHSWHIRRHAAETSGLGMLLHSFSCAYTHKWEGIVVKKETKWDAQKQTKGMTLIWILCKLGSGKNHFWDQKGNRRGGACYRSAAVVASVRWDSGAALVSPCCGYSVNIYKQTDMMFHLLWNTRAKWKMGKLEEKLDYRKLTTTTTTTNSYLFTAWECCRLTTHPDTSKQQQQ